MLRRDHQDPLAAPASDQLREEHPDLQRLAETHHVRDQYPRLRVLHRQCQLRRPQLVDLLVHEEVVRQRQPVLGLRQIRLPHDRFEEEPGPAVVRRVVRYQLGLPRVQLLHDVQPVVEGGVHVTDERRDAGDLKHPPITFGGRALAHEPQLVTDQDLRARRVSTRFRQSPFRRACARLPVAPRLFASAVHGSRLDAQHPLRTLAHGAPPPFHFT